MDFVHYEDMASLTNGNSGYQHTQDVGFPMVAGLAEPSARLLDDSADFRLMASIQDEELSIRPRLTKDQVHILESQFQVQPKPNSNIKRQIATQTSLTLPRVTNWFQNRRAKAKQQKKQEEFDIRRARGMEDESKSEGYLRTEYPTLETSVDVDGTQVQVTPTFSNASRPRYACQPPSNSLRSAHYLALGRHNSALDESWASLARALSAATAARDRHIQCGTCKHKTEPCAEHQITVTRTDEGDRSLPSVLNSDGKVEKVSPNALHKQESPEFSAEEMYSDRSTDYSISCEVHEGFADTPTELEEIQEALVGQVINEYVENWRPFRGYIRSRPAPQTTTSPHGQHQRTQSSEKPAPSAKSLGKRRRESEQSSDDLPGSDDDSKRQQPTCKPNQQNGRLFACPYAKYDPIRYSERNVTETGYRGCSSKLLRNIARVKQHLYRVHMRPAQYCSRCGMQFDCQDLLEAHSRDAIICDIQELPFKEKMTTEQRDAVHKRKPGRCDRKVWFEIFDTLFPGARIPTSSYANSGSPEAVQDFLDYFQERAPQILSTLIVQSGLSLSQYEQSMLDAAVEMAIPRLVQEFGTDFHSLSTDESQESPHSGLFAARPMIVSAVAEEPNSSLPQIEAGPSMIEDTGTSSNAVGFETPHVAERLADVSEWLSYLPNSIDDESFSQDPRTSVFAEFDWGWDDVLQPQMPLLA